jgi:hypothetical protein
MILLFPLKNTNIFFLSMNVLIKYILSIKNRCQSVIDEQINGNVFLKDALIFNPFRNNKL